MRYDAILFDLDGTLTESAPGIANSAAYALEKIGFGRVEPETLTYFVGPPLFESFRNLPGMDDSRARLAVETYRERFSAVGWRENSVYTGIPSLLRALKARGAYLAVASAKPLPFVRKILDYFALAPYFDRVEAIRLDDEHADKATLVRRALPQRFARACMVGDRSYDMLGARAMGVDGVGALYGYGSREELEESGACFAAKSPRELGRWLLGDEAEPRGLFFSFEGSDGCGKSTQADMAAKWLRACGYEVCATREPGGCPVSERIREMVLDPKVEGMTGTCEALLFAAARAQHVETVIRPALSRGEIVVCDRFVDSSVAYQGMGRELGLERVREINRPALNGLMPDRTLFYALDPREAMARREAVCSPDRIERERGAFVPLVYEGFERIAREEAGRVVRVDGSGSADEVFARTRALLAEILSR